VIVPERPVLVAPDSFKGTFRAAEVAAAVGRGLERAGLMPPDLCPLADGGEGTAEVVALALGGETGGATVRDPLGRPVQAGFVALDDGGAVLDMAAASGLTLLGEHERDPLRTTTHGTGELIVAAARAGADVVFVAAGGSATVDGGAGAVEAIAAAGGLGGVQLVVLCDVRTPWERAAAVFGPQKGADPGAVRELEARMDAQARAMKQDPRGVPMTGAAGGLAGALWSEFGATLESGANFVLDAVGYNARMLASRCVITGEGRLDDTSLQGKLVGEAATRARQAGVPCHAIVGVNALDAFGARIIDLQVILEATTQDELEAAGADLGTRLREARA
jgi:glycerate 2-kinase